jgi:hypothetical protein
MGMNLTRAFRIWRKKHISPLLRRIIYWVVLLALAIVGELALLYFLTALTAVNLIDWKTVTSFLAVEVLAAVVARMLGLGKESDEETRYRRMRLAQLTNDMVPHYAHLEVVCLKDEEEEYPEYPKSQYYIRNSDRHTAHWVPPTYCGLMQDGIIKCQIFPNARSLLDYLEQRKVFLLHKYPEGYELEPSPSPPPSSSVARLPFP